MAKAAKSKQPPRPMAPGRAAQQPMAQSGADLMRAIANLIPASGPLNAAPGSDVNWAGRKGQPKGKKR